MSHQRCSGFPRQSLGSLQATSPFQTWCKVDIDRSCFDAVPLRRFPPGTILLSPENRVQFSPIEGKHRLPFICLPDVTCTSYQYASLVTQTHLCLERSACSHKPTQINESPSCHTKRRQFLLKSALPLFISNPVGSKGGGSTLEGVIALAVAVRRV